MRNFSSRCVCVYVCVCVYMCECVVHASMCHFVLCVSLHEFAGKLFQWERLGRVRCFDTQV